MQFYQPGTLIANRYEVASRPMMGGMGIVYICLDHKEDRPVALKTFKPEYLPDRAARDRFLREGTVWVDLGAHQHIVRCYQVERTDDGSEVYLVLELIAKEQGHADASLYAWQRPGRSLSQHWVPGNPLTLEETLLLALQLVRGMQHATQCIPGFVHRDLKPHNLLIGADYFSNTDTHRLRITDFGLIRIIAENAHPVSRGLTDNVDLNQLQVTRGAGTPLYMAPEQWQGESIGAHTDIYALGCILYEMLTGQLVVEYSHDLQRAHCTGGLRSLPPTVPEPVRALVMRCLALDPVARYSTWDAVEAALEAAFVILTDRPAPEAERVASSSRIERVATGWSYNTMGYAYMDIGRTEVARDYFVQAREAGIAEGDRALEGSALGNLASAHRNLGDAWRAVKYYEQALKIVCDIGEQKGKGQVLSGLGNTYRSLGDARRAIEYYEQALEIDREVGNRQGEGSTLGNLGLAYADLGETQRAIGYYEQHLTIAHNISDRRGEGNALGNLGIAYLKLGDARRAVEYHKRSLVNKREIGNRSGEGHTLGNLGNAYLELGDIQRAIECQGESLAINREIGDRQGEGLALGSLGNAYLQLRDMPRAIDYYEQASAILEEIGDLRDTMIISFNLARSLAQLNRHAEALPYAERAAQFFVRVGHTQYTQFAQQLVKQLHEKMENSE